MSVRRTRVRSRVLTSGASAPTLGRGEQDKWLIFLRPTVGATQLNQSSGGTSELATARSGVPTGLFIDYGVVVHSDKSLGYCRMSLRDSAGSIARSEFLRIRLG